MGDHMTRGECKLCDWDGIFHLGPCRPYAEPKKHSDRITDTADESAALRVRALEGENERLRSELLSWHQCMQFDALMSVPLFKGWNRSQMERCRKNYEATAALAQETSNE